jgi:outer membrane biosynthesis protein TonB
MKAFLGEGKAIRAVIALLLSSAALLAFMAGAAVGATNYHCEGADCPTQQPTDVPPTVVSPTVEEPTSVPPTEVPQPTTEPTFEPTHPPEPTPTAERTPESTAQPTVGVTPTPGEPYVPSTATPTPQAPTPEATPDDDDDEETPQPIEAPSNPPAEGKAPVTLPVTGTSLAIPDLVRNCVYGYVEGVHKHAFSAHVVVRQLYTHDVFTCSITLGQYKHLTLYPQFFYRSCLCVRGAR